MKWERLAWGEIRHCGVGRDAVKGGGRSGGGNPILDLTLRELQSCAWNRKSGSSPKIGWEIQQRYKLCWGLLMKPGPLRKGLWAFALTGGVQKALHHAQTIYTMILLASGGVQTAPLRNSFCIYKVLWTCKIFQNFWSVCNFPCFSSSAFPLHNNVSLTFKILLHHCKIHVRFQSIESQWCKLIHQNQRKTCSGKQERAGGLQ